MMKLALILVLCTGTLAQLPSLGKCPDLQVVQNFDVKKYIGTWYDFGNYFVFSELEEKCTAAEYSLNKNGTIHLLKTQVNKITGKRTNIEGTAELVGENGEGKLSASFPSVDGDKKRSLFILNTDYSNFAVFYSCQDFGIYNTRQARILTRHRTPKEDAVFEAYKTLEANGFERKYFTATDHEDC